MHHEVRLSGLTPDTVYHYAVGSESGTSTRQPSFQFRTPPVVGTPAPFRAWIVGDSGTGRKAQRDVRDAMLAATGARPPDLFLHMGDMAYSSGTEPEFGFETFIGPVLCVFEKFYSTVEVRQPKDKEDIMVLVEPE